MGIIDSYQQKQLELESAKERERKELISRSYEKFDALLNENAIKLKDQIASRGIFVGYFEIKGGFQQNFFHPKPFSTVNTRWSMEEPYFFYDVDGIKLKDGIRCEKHHRHFFSEDSYCIEKTEEGSYYIDEICKRFLKLAELGEDEIFQYRAAICFDHAQPLALPCEFIPKGLYTFDPCCGLAIKYSLTKRR